MKNQKNVYLPIINTLKNYQKSFIKDDVFAGLTVASVLIPQAMAYALLAGVPPIYGLYTGLVPLVIYALFASSTKMSVGPVAVSSLLVLSGVSALAEPGTPEYLSLVIASGLLIGIFQALIGFLRLGFVVNFLSHAVIVGFTSAAAIIILVSQLKDALGFSIPHTEHLYGTIQYAVLNIAQTNPISLVISLATVLIILLFKKISRSIPGALLVVLLAIAFSYFLNFEKHQVDIVGKIPGGLPTFQLVDISWEQFKLLIPTVLTVTLIGIVESMGIAKALEAKHNDHQVYPNTELKALGFAKFVGAFFQAIPSSGSFTRSAINSEAGAKTSISALVTALLILLTLLFFTGVFYYLPKPVLAGIILLSVFSLFNIQEAKYLWKVRKTDFFMMLATFICTLLLGIELGVLVGVVCSILVILYKISNPKIVRLGKLPNSNSYKDLSRFPEAVESEEVVIFRFENQLFFANVAIFRDKILSLLDTKPDMKHLLLDAKLIHDIDSSGTHMLKEMDNLLKDKNIELHLCGAIGSVRDRLYKADLLKELEYHHLSVADAVARINDPANVEERKYRATQQNVDKS